MATLIAGIVIGAVSAYLTCFVRIDTYQLAYEMKAKELGKARDREQALRAKLADLRDEADWWKG